MAYQVIDLNCPGCGGGVSTSQKQCTFCGRPIVITSFSDINSTFNWNKYKSENNKALSEHPDNDALNMSQAMSFLKLRFYDDALEYFKKALVSEMPETFYYMAICLLKGKKAFVANRKEQIDIIVEKLEGAIMIDPKGIYYYFLAYIKYDYFERKYLNITPNWEETLQTAIQTGVSSTDVTQLFEMLQVEMPECLKV